MRNDDPAESLLGGFDTTCFLGEGTDAETGGSIEDWPGGVAEGVGSGK